MLFLIPFQLLRPLPKPPRVPSFEEFIKSMPEYYVAKVEKCTNGVKEVFRRNIQYDPFPTYEQAEKAATERLRGETSETELVVFEIKARITRVPVYEIHINKPSNAR